jgi:hypothetical protein
MKKLFVIITILLISAIWCEAQVTGIPSSTVNMVQKSDSTVRFVTPTQLGAILDTMPKLNAENVWPEGQKFGSYIKVHSRTISAPSYDTLLTTDVIVYVNGLGGGTGVVLPNPADFTDKLLIVKDINLGFELYPHLSETIDGQASLNVASYESYILTSNGTNWFILSKK